METVNTNTQKEVKIKPSLYNAVKRMREAKTFIVRPWTPIGARWRVLDIRMNPLATLTNQELKMLLDNNVISEADHLNKYKYNESVSITA